MANYQTKAFVAAAFSVSVAVGFSPLAWGQSSLPPNPAELIQALKAKGKTRGLRVPMTPADTARAEKQKKLFEALRRKGTRGLSVEERETLPQVVGDRPSVDIEIYFDYNSAAITSKAKPALASLGRALRDRELKGQSFLLAGHTDAKGGNEYNQSLSERRALAVKTYLMKNYDVPDFELFAIGYGEDQLKRPDDPYAPQNRRVQVVNMGASVTE